MMKKKSKPLISIGLPAHNGEQVISDAIESLLRQTYKNFELIISDDASTDATQKICETYVKKDKRIRYVRQKKNLGFVDNFNFVLQKAKGKFFMWAGQDDMWNPKFIESLLNLYTKYPDAVLAMSGYANVYKGKKYPSKQSAFDNMASPFYSVKHFISSYNLSYFYGLHKTSNLKTVGGYKKDSRPFFKSSDYVTILRVLMNGKMVFINTILFYKRDTGLYFQKFSVLQTLSFSKKVIRAIMRYLCFPIFFVYDFLYTLLYVFASSFSVFEKCMLTVYALYAYLKRNAIFLFEVFLGIIALSTGIFRKIFAKKI